MNIAWCTIRIIGSGIVQNACIASVTGTRNAAISHAPARACQPSRIGQSARRLTSQKKRLGK
jgi:hypothetical protein